MLVVEILDPPLTVCPISGPVLLVNPTKWRPACCIISKTMCLTNTSALVTTWLMESMQRSINHLVQWKVRWPPPCSKVTCPDVPTWLYKATWKNKIRSNWQCTGITDVSCKTSTITSNYRQTWRPNQRMSIIEVYLNRIALCIRFGVDNSTAKRGSLLVMKTYKTRCATSSGSVIFTGVVEIKIKSGNCE